MDTAEIKEALKETGLMDEEITVYLALLKLGSSLASKISEETQVNRSHVYQLLERLITKGFASYVIKENRKYFNAVNPEKIIDILQEKEQKLQNILPSLIGLAHLQKEKPLVEIFEGKEGIKTILNDILRVKKTWLAFGSSGKSPEVLSYYSEHWEKEREKRKIPLRGILDCSKSGLLRGRILSKLKFTQIRHTSEKYANPSSTWIYGDRLVFVVWSKEHPLAIRMISKEFTENFISHFEVLWKNAHY